MFIVNSYGQVIHKTKDFTNAIQHATAVSSDNNYVFIIDETTGERIWHRGKPRHTIDKKTGRHIGRHNGDFVSVFLHGLNNDSIKDVALLLLDKCINSGSISGESKINSDVNKIISAEERKNVGSGRMSLGLMIRKYCKKLGIYNVRGLKEAIKPVMEDKDDTNT